MNEHQDNTLSALTVETEKLLASAGSMRLALDGFYRAKSQAIREKEEAERELAEVKKKVDVAKQQHWQLERSIDSLKSEKTAILKKLDASLESIKAA
jgi:septal ring factor EnvC (AmiA/AmiB activator)